MFKCDTCNKVTEPCEPQNKKVIETRNVTYKHFRDGIRLDDTHGTEIVKEIKVCSACA